LQNKPDTGESQYGKWFLYNVIANNQEQSLFAPEQVQNFIEENQLKKGDVMQITKTMIKNGRNNVIDFKIEVISKHTKPVNKPEEIRIADDIAVMKDCLKSAIELQLELGPVVDVNRIALSLYISRTKNGNGYQF